MKLATLILPTVSNNGVEQSTTHAALQSTLADTFGGFTVTNGNGSWRDESTGRLYVDPVAVYSIAMAETLDNVEKLESIARFFGHMASQLCVMVTHCNGTVAFVECNAKAETFTTPTPVRLSPRLATLAARKLQHS